MAVFSTFQNRHLYVATAYNNSTAAANADDPISEESAVGTIELKCVDRELYFIYKGADTVLRSDRIPLRNLDYVKAVAAKDMQTLLKSVKVTLSSDVNSGNPVAGQDYVLRIVFRQFYGMSDQDVYIKDAVVHATAAMAANKKEFYKAMVKALNLAFSRELGATKESNPYLEFSAGTSGSEDGIYITEKEQPWSLGTKAQERVFFDVYPTTVFYQGDDINWATETDGKFYQDISATTDSTVGNGKKIADLEYFCMGERGDQYRNIGWPNVVPTKYLVDPSKEYNALELHFAFTDDGVSSYRSEKDITIVAEDAKVINDIIDAIGEATGINITPLETT